MNVGKILSVNVLGSFLVACSGQSIPLPIITPVTSPSSLPVIISATPPFISSPTSTIIILSATPTFPETPSLTQTNTLTPDATFTSTATATNTPTSTSTATNTPFFTYTPTTNSSQPTQLTLEILGCNTSLDILHQMGEVTNVYPIVRNYTAKTLTNVCSTLSASDEARVHPDKTACVVALPAGFQVTLKLTVDTGTGRDTAILVVVNTTEGDSASLVRSSCQAIGFPGWLPDQVGVFEPVP